MEPRAMRYRHRSPDRWVAEERWGAENAGDNVLFPTHATQRAPWDAQRRGVDPRSRGQSLPHAADAQYDVIIPPRARNRLRLSKPAGPITAKPQQRSKKLTLCQSQRPPPEEAENIEAREQKKEDQEKDNQGVAD